MPERWQSGRSRYLGKVVNVDSVPRVRIPLSPPFSLGLMQFCKEKTSIMYFFTKNRSNSLTKWANRAINKY